MSPEEARIIRDVFERLRAFGPVRDTEARAAVEAELRANPDAGVALVQAIVGLERERVALTEQLAAYERAQEAPQSGGLFGGGPWGRRDAPERPTGWPQQPQRPDDGRWSQQPPAQQQPWGQQQQPQQQPWGQQPQQQRGGGLFGTLLGAATGLAAGYVGYEAMKGLFGGGGHANAGDNGGLLGGGLFGGGNEPGNELGNDRGGGFFDERDRTSADDAAFFDDNGGDFDIGGGGDDDNFA